MKTRRRTDHQTARWKARTGADPLIEAPPLRLQVYTRLREAIFAGELAAGTRVSPGEIARRFGVSTMPVREALAFLVEEGLIETSPRRWTRVASPDGRVADEIYPLLALLEEYAVVSGRAPKRAMIARLRRANAALADAGERGDVIGCMDADSAFHETLTGLSRNSTLARILSDLKTRIRLLEGAYFRLDHLEESLADHDAIIEALVGSDREEAARLAQANWLRGHRRVRGAID